MLQDVWPEVVEHLMVRMGVASQADFADKVGLHAQTISRWINGHSKPSPRSLNKIAGAGQMELNELLYIYTRYQEKRYAPWKVPLDIDDELRDEEAADDETRLFEQARKVVDERHHDLPPQLRPTLAGLRDDIRDQIVQHDAGIERLRADVNRYQELREAAMAMRGRGPSRRA